MGCGVMSVISKSFAKSKFQTFETNFEFGTLDEQITKLVQTWSQQYTLAVKSIFGVQPLATLAVT